MISMKSFILNLLILSTIVWTIETRDQSLCDNPYIYGADRLLNNTVRVYRDLFYWDLIGFPDRSVNVKGPFRIWQEYMSPFDEYSSIQTVTSGQLKGVTFKYKGNRFWSWHPTGIWRTGPREGDIWDLMPNSNSVFYATYNDGDLDQKGFSQLVAFADIHVYYYNTNGNVFKQIDSIHGYIRGKDGENFPEDLTAAFAFPNQNSTNYLVYLFRRDKYCVRTHLGVDDCPEWRENRELFGCNKGSASLDTRSDATPPNEQKGDDKGVVSMSNISTQINFILLILCLSVLY